VFTYFFHPPSPYPTFFTGVDEYEVLPPLAIKFLLLVLLYDDDDDDECGINSDDTIGWI
jgi:hypothetical protein